MIKAIASLRKLADEIEKDARITTDTELQEEKTELAVRLQWLAHEVATRCKGRTKSKTLAPPEQCALCAEHCF